MKKSALFLLLSALLQVGFAQPNQNVLDYIEKYKATAMNEMVRCDIPASVTLAQGIHESNCGKSPLSREANNHFGIKCKEGWTGKKYIQDDDTRDECFRVYEHAEASYADHSDFLVTRPRYAGLFKLEITDYKGWAHGLKECGYATNPKYAHILIKEIEEYNLQQYDQMGLAMREDKKKMHEQDGTPSTAPAAKNTTPAKPASSTTTAETTIAMQPAPVVVEEKKEEKHNIFEVETTQASSRKQYVINGSLALIAEEDEDPLKVAYENNIDYSYVLMFNDLQQGENFKGGEYIFLQSKKNRGADEKYVVKAGESMRDVSQKMGIKLKELYTRNKMGMNEQVYAGETLYLQEKRSDVPRVMSYAEFLKTVPAEPVAVKADTAVPVTNNTSKTTTTTQPTSRTIIYDSHYQVQASDTLYSIARKFNTTVETLKNLNNLESTSIQEGQKLVVTK